MTINASFYQPDRELKAPQRWTAPALDRIDNAAYEIYCRMQSCQHEEHIETTCRMIGNFRRLYAENGKMKAHAEWLACEINEKRAEVGTIKFFTNQ